MRLPPAFFAGGFLFFARWRSSSAGFGGDEIGPASRVSSATFFVTSFTVDGGVSTTGTIGYVKMRGREVFRHAVEKLASAMDEVLELANLTSDDIDWLVPHQANIRIINAMQKKLNLPDNKVIKTVSEHANTSAASIPLALAFGVESGKIKPGHLLALEAIGGGLTWGASLVRYGRPA